MLRRLLLMVVTGCSSAQVQMEPIAIELRFEQEERDEAWARVAESSLDSIQDLVEGVRLVSAECKTSLCRFDYMIDGSDIHRKADRVMTEIHHIMRRLDVFEQEMEGTHLSSDTGELLLQIFIPRVGSHI